MEKNKKFRNHFSIVFERLGAGFLAFSMIFLYEGAELLREIGTVLKDIENLGDELFTILLAALGIILLFSMIAGLQVFRWAKTWISIQEQAIVIEVNTLKRKKNTIGIKNISNINLEQNLFERMMGTCKVKMDTNSMSTADSTDVQIVLKKEQAQKFQKLILGMIEESYQVKDSRVVAAADEQINEPGAGIEEMMVQGIFSLKLISIPLLLLSIIGMVSMISEVVQEGTLEEGVFSVLSSVLLIGVFGASVLWDIIKGFIQYYGFKSFRVGDRLYIRYGLIKKVSYTIPVDKINAVKLVQTPQARIMGRYMAELVNVGLGDDIKEEQSFFLLYAKKEAVLEKIRKLLPEFSDELDTEAHRQTSKVWIVWMLPATIYMIVMAATMFILTEFLKKEMVIVVAVIVTATVFILLCVVGNYFTKGYYVGEKSLKLVNGYIGKKILLVKYSKIQHMETEQNFLAKYFRIQKGSIHLLASATNSVHTIPYFPEEEVSLIRERILSQ